MAETVYLTICILSFVLAFISVVTVLLTLRQNSKQIKFNEEQLEEMREEHRFSMQPILMFENPVFKVERPRAFYAPPQKLFSIQSRYFLEIDVKNVTQSVAVFVDAVAILMVGNGDDKMVKSDIAMRKNILTKGEKTTFHFMFLYDKDERLYNALREDDPRLLPRVAVILFYKNTSGGCFRTTTQYTIELDEKNESVIKEWHTFLNSVGIRYKEELDKMKREGDRDGIIFDTIKDKMNKELGDERDIDINCFEDIEKYRYESIKKEEYEEVRSHFRYPTRLMKAPYCCDNTDGKKNETS